MCLNIYYALNVHFANGGGEGEKITADKSICLGVVSMADIFISLKLFFTPPFVSKEFTCSDDTKIMNIATRLYLLLLRCTVLQENISSPTLLCEN